MRGNKFTQSLINDYIEIDEHKHLYIDPQYTIQTTMNNEEFDLIDLDNIQDENCF